MVALNLKDSRLNLALNNIEFGSALTNTITSISVFVLEQCWILTRADIVWSFQELDIAVIRGNCVNDAHAFLATPTHFYHPILNHSTSSAHAGRFVAE